MDVVKLQVPPAGNPDNNTVEAFVHNVETGAIEGVMALVTLTVEVCACIQLVCPIGLT